MIKNLKKKKNFLDDDISWLGSIFLGHDLISLCGPFVNIMLGNEFLKFASCFDHNFKSEQFI